MLFSWLVACTCAAIENFIAPVDAFPISSKGSAA
jgi:hypothetical protein